MTFCLNETFAIIVLAAGKSSRLGQMKQLVMIKDKSLVELQLEQALKVSNKVYCVLGFNAKQIAARIEHLPTKLIINNQWAEGMASSIAAGIDALTPDIKSVMLILVDQWQLTTADLMAHQSHWLENPRAIVVAQNASAANISDNIGPPVIFPRHYFDELSQLTGMQGAKPVLQKYQANLLKVPLAHAFIDLDTPEQLHTLHESLA